MSLRGGRSLARGVMEAAFFVDGSARAADATPMDTTPPLAAQPPPSFEPTTPKADLFTWCGMTKVPVPTYAIAEAPGGFEGRAVLVLPEGVSLTTEVHRARGRKLVEHAASAELLVLLEKHVGPEGMRPPPAAEKKAKKPKTGGTPAPPPPAPAVRVPTEGDRRAARLAALHRALSPASTAKPLEAMNTLKQLGYVRRLRVELRAHPARTFLVHAECVREDGSRVCLAPFEATSRMEAETRAAIKAIESLAASLGLRPRLSPGGPR